MTETYWEVTVRMNRTFLRSAPVYSLRTDLDTIRSKNMVAIFLSDCLQVCNDATKQNGTLACFEHYCRTMGVSDRLTFAEVGRVLQDYVEREKSQFCLLGRSPNQGFGNLNLEDHSKYITIYILESDLGATVLAATTWPHLVRTLSSLLPYSFPQVLNKLSKNSRQQQNKFSKDSENSEQENRQKNECGQNAGDSDTHHKKSRKSAQQKTPLALADAMTRQSPWEFCFREIVKRKLRLYGLEASLKEYKNAGFMSITPLTQRDALHIYEVMKTDAKRDGHVYIPFRILRGHIYFRRLDYQIDGLERWELALDYLETNGVTQTEEFAGDRNIFLHHNWQAEVDTTEAVSSILDRHQLDPLDWDVDLFSPEFSHLLVDNDQLKACQLICSAPIVVMSGRGGCGKTTVITSLLKHLCNRQKKRIEEEDKESQQCLSTFDDDVDKNHKQAQERQVHSHIPSSTEGAVPGVGRQLSVVLENSCLEGSLPGLSVSAQAVKECSGKELSTVTSETSPGTSATAELISNPDRALTGHDPEIRQKVKNTQVPSRSEGPDCLQRGDTKIEMLKRELVCDLLKILSSQSSETDEPALDEYKSKMLLTAPTGKAARLLGCKAQLPSATLHSVLASWQVYMSQGSQEQWKYAEVEVLVVDECSLVSMRLFSNVAKVLLNNAKLRKLVLLGDVRQLPSIEPGDFLKDMFKTFSRVSVEADSEAKSGLGVFNLAVELTNNHRSESQLIVSNAELISCMKMPTFDSGRNFHLVNAELRGGDNERDVAIRNLLQTSPDLRSHVNSQFVAFRNAHCSAVNELCCHFYNNHSIKKPSQSGRREKSDFRVGDKVCLTKNSQVSSLHSVYLDRYRADFPELREALDREEGRLREMLRRKAEKEEEKKEGTRPVPDVATKPLDISTVEVKAEVVGKVGFGVDEVLNLMDQDDDVFNSTIAEMMEREEAQRQKEERIHRARQKQSAWRTKSEKIVLKNALVSSLGKPSEKLCNGEVFFIMDEFDHFDEKTSGSRRQSNGAALPRRYLLLSDRDPDMPRVVCVALRELIKACRMKHSWARTIHTYQGSESGTVVYVLGPAMPQTWQHVYTAVTRGRNSVFVLGDWEQLHKAINRRDAARRTRLAHRLREALKHQAACIHMCCEEFHKRQRQYWSSTVTSVKLDSDTPDRVGDEFGSDDSWLLQAVSLEDQASLDAIPELDAIDDDLKEQYQMIKREKGTTSQVEELHNNIDVNSNRQSHSSTQGEAGNNSHSNFKSYKNDEDLEFDGDWDIDITSSSSSEEEEESIFAPLHKFREKTQGNNTQVQDITSKVVKEDKDDDDCLLITQSQYMGDHVSLELDECLFDQDFTLSGETTSGTSSNKNLGEHISDRLSAQEKHLRSGQHGAQTGEPEIRSSHEVSFSTDTPSTSARQISNVAPRPCSQKYETANGHQPSCMKTSLKPLTSSQGMRSPGKRSLNCDSQNGFWEASGEVSPTKLSRTRDAVASPFLASFSESLTLDADTDAGTETNSCRLGQEESPFPVKRKL
ncbi:hypothetical protein EGW08_016458 [Elysia chlorotica]|uniref:DNA helicase B winged helix domain-containing protein n=1 Tax=Elysia chlorotica TaxID=188477 RepID=A0A3S1B4F8_ELYCH|nr:hypothetical protein EGW08_016458 [Elysia chlorotica]